MFRKYAWEGNRKYGLGIALIVMGLMLYFGEATMWVAE